MRATDGFLLVPLILLSWGAPGLAEGGAAGKGGVFPEVADASDGDAEKILEALRAAAAGKDDGKMVEAVAPMVTKRHRDFVPELKKLLADRRDPVSAEAAKALGSQSDKSIAPILQKLLAARTRDKDGLLRDPETKAAAAEALGRLGESRAAAAVLDLANDMRGAKEVKEKYARRVVRGCVRYFGLVKYKEAVSYLIDEVDQPKPKDPNSNTNPGEEYWKYRFDIWKEIRPEVIWALKEITGKEFETERRWENWFKEEGRKAGMK